MRVEWRGARPRPWCRNPRPALRNIKLRTRECTEGCTDGNPAAASAVRRNPRRRLFVRLCVGGGRSRNRWIHRPGAEMRRCVPSRRERVPGSRMSPQKSWLLSSPHCRCRVGDSSMGHGPWRGRSPPAIRVALHQQWFHRGLGNRLVSTMRSGPVKTQRGPGACGRTRRPRERRSPLEPA